MTDDIRSRLERVLGYEDLDDAAREETDSLLAAEPRLRELLEALRAREAEARLRGGLPPEDRWSTLALDEPGRRDERASLAALIARGAGTAAIATPRARRHAPWLTWLVPAAAAAAALLLWPRSAAVPPTLRERAPARTAPTATAAPEWFAIERASEHRGGAVSEWREGDAFRLRFHLASPARPVLFVLDASGALARLHPPAGAAAALAAAGDVELPVPGGDTRWTFSGPPGVETFFAVAAPEGVDIVRLSAAADSAVAAVAAADGRAARIAALEAAVRARGAGVRRLDVAHR